MWQKLIFRAVGELFNFEAAENEPPERTWEVRKDGD